MIRLDVAIVVVEASLVQHCRRGYGERTYVGLVRATSTRNQHLRTSTRNHMLHAERNSNSSTATTVVLVETVLVLNM